MMSALSALMIYLAGGASAVGALQRTRRWIWLPTGKNQWVKPRGQDECLVGADPTEDTHACRMASDLLGFFVVEDPAYEKYASGYDSQSYRDTNRRSHFFDQVEDHSHVLIPF